MPQLDPDAANAAIRTLLTTLYASDTNYFRPANQNAPTGHINQPFATVLVTGFDPVGQDAVTQEDEGVPLQLTENIEGQRHLVCDVQFFRSNALLNANRLNALLRSSSTMMLLQQAGLGFIRASKTLNLTSVVDTYYEERAQVELEFYVSSLESLSVSTFSSVEITIQTESQSIAREVNLDVNS